MCNSSPVPGRPHRAADYLAAEKRAAVHGGSSRRHDLQLGQAGSDAAWQGAAYRAAAASPLEAAIAKVAKFQQQLQINVQLINNITEIIKT